MTRWEIVFIKRFGKTYLKLKEWLIVSYAFYTTRQQRTGFIPIHYKSVQLGYTKLCIHSWTLLFGINNFNKINFNQNFRCNWRFMASFSYIITIDYTTIFQPRISINIKIVFRTVHPNIQINLQHRESKFLTCSGNVRGSFNHNQMVNIFVYVL